MTELSVRAMRPTDAANWNAFVENCREATFFHRFEWKEIIERAFGHRTYFFLAEANGKIAGILPLAQIRHFLFGHSLSSLPFCVYGGIAAETEAARELLDHAAQKLASDLNVDYLEYRNLRARHADWPTKDIYVTFRKPIDKNVEQNMKNIPHKQRAMVRRGIKHGLASSLDDTIDRFYTVFSDNMLRHGTPALPKSYFTLLKQIFGRDCEVLSVTLDGEVVSSVLSFYFKNEVLPYYAGDTIKARSLAANDFKYWELMRRACERGCTVFDYGRSKCGTGSFDFKKNWGFEPSPLHYEYQLHRAKQIPEQSPLNPKYQIFIKAWRRLPMPVANFIGPHIVKNLG